MIGTGDLRRGVTIEIDGTIYQLLEFQHIKLGRGSAQVRMKLRDIRGGHTIERVVQAGERFIRATLEKRTVRYLYSDNDLYFFMDSTTYEQFPLSQDQIETALPYLTDNMELELVSYQDEPIGVEMPNTVVLRVAETAPAFRGDTAASGPKPARLETGLVVQVPMFVETGARIVVDTRSGAYVERAS